MADAKKTVNPDDIYPTPPRPDSAWWVVRTTIVQGSTTLLAYTPLSVQQHPYKDKAEQYMKDKVALTKPTEVKIIGGPFSREEAFAWTTLNPYTYDNGSGGGNENVAATKKGEKSSNNSSTNSTNNSNSSNNTPAKNSNDPDPYADDPNAA